MIEQLVIRDMQPAEYEPLGELMVAVYSQLDGFPTPDEQPRYYELLQNIWTFTGRKDARVLVALTQQGELVGGVVYFGDMAEYGSGGSATRETNASGIRLLAVDPTFRGSGAGRALTDFCISLAREKDHSSVILHTTQAMQLAWGLYERMGFVRSPDLDFMQEGLPVFGFRLSVGTDK